MTGVMEMKKSIDALSSRLKKLEEERNKLYAEKDKIEREYYPLVGSKYVGKCYKEEVGDPEDKDIVAEIHYYKVLKVRGSGEFWAERISVQSMPPRLNSERHYTFSIATYYNPMRRDEIPVEEYERVKTELLKEIKEGLKVIE
jgi:hypothetical protein